MAGETPATVEQVVALVPEAGAVGPSSTGSITVATVPVPPGATLTYKGLTLTAVAVARTPGSNDFDGSLATVALVAAEIQASLADAANSWLTTMTGTVSADVLSLTTVGTGSDTVDALASSDASMTTTGLEGGDFAIQTYVDLAASMVNVDCWGEKTCDGTRFLTLHFLASTFGGIPGGKPTGSSIKIKGIAKTYAVAAPTDPLFGATKWGHMYLMLYDTVFCSGTTGGSLCLGVTG